MSQTLLLIRGLPGSGKTTYAKGLGCIFFEADQYFIDRHSVYCYDANRLKDAHDATAFMADVALFKGYRLVAVTGTMAQKWEFEKYIKLANRYGAKYKVIHCKGHYRSIHAVPPEVYKRMYDRWEPFDGERMYYG